MNESSVVCITEKKFDKSNTLRVHKEHYLIGSKLTGNVFEVL